LKNAPSIAAYHGECKTPGGKLAMVDFALVGRRMIGVQISGDFFAYPEDIPARMQAALENAVVPVATAEIEDMLIAVLTESDVLLGASPAAIAEAVRRALEVAASS
jgi:lipoate-protein ligase A